MTDTQLAYMTEAPCFVVSRHNGHFETRGQCSAEFGHRLPSTTQGVDDGVFACWHWDGTRLVVNNDRYGFYPLFWFRAPGGGVGISSSLVSLIERGASTDLDVDALSVFFRLGIFVGDDTPFATIKVVPPNAVFAWEAGELECHGRLPAAPKAAAISRNEAIDRYIDLFAKAMAKRAPATGSFAVPISGGRDSRHILLELHRTGIRPKACVSALDNPPDPNQDPEIAKSLCDELGLKHVVVDQQWSVLSAEIRKNRETHFCASAHGWYLALADFLRGRFDCAYDGLAGDVLSQSAFLNPHLDATFHTGNVTAICEELLSRYATAESVLKGLLKGPLKQALLRETAIARLSGEVQKHLDMPNPTASFFFWNRTRRMTALAPFGLLWGIPTVYAPFLDHDLFDFMITLPAAMLLDRTFHSDAIARAYPAFAHIPYADHKRATPADDTAVRARFMAEATRMYVMKPPSSLMKNVMPRAKMLAGALSNGHLAAPISPLIIYLDQIESIIHHRPWKERA